VDFWDTTFNTFPHQPLSPEERKALTPEFKNRTIFLCLNNYPDTDTQKFWHCIYKRLAVKLGKFSELWDLFPYANTQSLLDECDDDTFLIFVEFIFKAQTDPAFTGVGKISPDEINRFFDECDLPYKLTGFNKRRQKIIDYPKVIIRDSEVVYQLSVKPTLDLLRSKQLQGANQEFMDALQHFRQNEFGYCVAMCGSSLESVMKTICVAKGWHKRPNGLTGSDLLKIITRKSSLNPYYVKLNELIHVIRDNESIVHGGEKEIRNPPQHIAQFALNMTASTILFLVDETKPFS
jgi:hypothetical protein